MGGLSLELAPHPIDLADDEYFLLGDNSRQSMDCRFFGPVKNELLVGVTRWRYWPPARWHQFR
jgi:signal peptidase I